MCHAIRKYFSSVILCIVVLGTIQEWFRGQSSLLEDSILTGHLTRNAVLKFLSFVFPHQ